LLAETFFKAYGVEYGWINELDVTGGEKYYGFAKDGRNELEIVRIEKMLSDVPSSLQKRRAWMEYCGWQ